MSNPETAKGIHMQILNNVFSLEDLRIISNALNFKFKEMQRRAARAFLPGDKVEFVGKGVHYKGTVQKVNQKTVTVKVFDGRIWRVSGNLLTLRD